jgi:adenylate cyclase
VLKGKHIPTPVFEPLSPEEIGSERVTAYLAAYKLMDASAQGALAAFQALYERYPDDALVGYHLQRLQAGENGSLIVMERK